MSVWASRLYGRETQIICNGRYRGDWRKTEKKSTSRQQTREGEENLPGLDILEPEEQLGKTDLNTQEGMKKKRCKGLTLRGRDVKD